MIIVVSAIMHLVVEGKNAALLSLGKKNGMTELELTACLVTNTKLEIT